METKRLTTSERDLRRAAAILLAGGVAAVPTETVYGLAANGLSEETVQKIFAAKGRPEDKPISLFVAQIEDAEDFCHVTDQARRLAGAFWPGPLTLILKAGEKVPRSVTAGGDTVGVRVPDDGRTLWLLRATKLPLTGTSANLSGRPAARTGAEALAIFQGRVDAVVDAGACPGGVPSTVLDLTGERPKILRPGAISREVLEKALGLVIE